MSRHRTILTQPPFEFCSEFIAVMTRATTEGFTLPSEAIQRACDKHLREMKASGMWDELDVYYLFSYNDLALQNFSLINWKNPSGDLITTHGGITYTVGGWEGNNIDGYIDTLFSPADGTNNYLVNDACIGGVTYNSTVGGARPFIGALSSLVRIYLNGSGNHRINTNENLLATVDMQGEGLKLMTRTSSTSVFLVNKGVQTTLASNSAGMPASGNTLFFLRIGANYGTNIISSGFMGGAITFAQSQAYRSSFNEFLSKRQLTPIA